jgi:hypothetical protein
MAMLTLDISMSLDGFVAGPNPTLDEPLGEGGERLHEWAIALEGWREQHGMSCGETNVENDVVEEARANTGATLMGRPMFSGGGPDRLSDRSYIGPTLEPWTRISAMRSWWRRCGEAMGWRFGS